MVFPSAGGSRPDRTILKQCVNYIIKDKIKRSIDEDGDVSIIVLQIYSST